MQRQKVLPAPELLPVPRSGILIAEGYGLRLYVRNGVLHIEDGEGPNGRLARLPRAAAKGRRVVLLGRAGSISVEAFRWMADAGVGFALIDAAAGRVVASSAGRGTDLPSLRRAQAVAGIEGSPVGLEVARYLIAQKLAGQHRVLERHLRTDQSERAIAVVRYAQQEMSAAASIAEVTGLESRAASAYWSAWNGLEVRFERKDNSRIPTHWRSFDSRGSILSSGPRLATSPLNAVLSLASALAEVECTLALLAVGLDPSLGIVHVDQRSRASLSLDVLESVRGLVEGPVISLVGSREFAKGDVYETRRGVFRVGTELARELAEEMPLWRRAVAPHIENVAQILARSARRPLQLPTPLTQASRASSRAKVTASFPFAPPKACRGCGLVLSDRGRAWCDECLPRAAAEQSRRMAAAGREVQARMRAEGRDPTHGGEAGKRHAAAAAQRRAEQAAWEGEPRDPEEFRQEILPGLVSVPLLQIVEATGLSISYAHLVRKGQRVPHPRWWAALQGLAGTYQPAP